MRKEIDQFVTRWLSEDESVLLNDNVKKILMEISYISPRQSEDDIANLKSIYDKYIDKNYIKYFASLPRDIQEKLTNDETDIDEFKDLFQDLIATPILQQTLKQLQQKCDIGALKFELSKQDIEKIFTDNIALKQNILETTADDSKLDKFVSIFDSQKLQSESDTWTTFLCNRLSAPIRASQQATQSRPFLDLSNFVIIGDIDCSGYKTPKSATDLSTLFKILPLGIIGKLICSGWDKNLFAQIDKLPFADTIDCSFSINSLDDLIGKLPNGLKTLVVQETLIKPNALQNDAKKLQSAQKFMETYPNLMIVDAKGKYNLADTVNQLTTSTKKDEQKPVAKKADSKSQPVQPTKKQEKTYTIDEVVAMFPDTDSEKLHQWIEQEIKDKHKQIDKKTGQTLLTQKAVNRIADLADKDAQDKSQQKKTGVKEQEKKPEMTTDGDTQKSQNIIKIYIKQSDLNKDENLYSILGNFNVWPQPNHISKKSNNTCCYIDAENKEKLLNGMKFKTTSSLSYGINASRHDFKIVKLIDIDENGEIKPVLDNFGKEIFIMVCVKYFKKHEKNSKENHDHKRIINNLDIYVTPRPLTKPQQNKIHNCHQNVGNDTKFFVLSDLDKSYMQFTYTPYDTPDSTHTDTAKTQPSPTPDNEPTEKAQESVVANTPVVADKSPVTNDKIHNAQKSAVSKSLSATIPVAEQKTKQKNKNQNTSAIESAKPKSLLDLTSLEKIVNELSTMLQDANCKLGDAKQKHATISSEIAEKTANGSFNLLQALYAKAQSATTDVITAQQNVDSVSARFNRAKSLLEQRNIALAEKEAAEKVLKTKQEILQNTDNEIKKFLQESINTNQR